MSRKTRKRKKKKKTSSKIAILLIVVFGFITVIVWYQSQVQNGGSRDAQDYFEVVSAGVDSGRVENNGTVYILTGISLTFKAVGGNAHEVVIQSWADSDPILIGTMLKDVPRTVYLLSDRGYATSKEPDGFPVTIRIASLEASGKFKFYLSD